MGACGANEARRGVDTPPPRYRRWCRISLRTLLVLLTLAAVWLAMTFNRVREQRAAVARIQALGGSVVYDYEYDLKGRYTANATPPGPGWLRRLVGPDLFENVTEVHLRGAAASDADLRLIGKLRQLQVLDLSGTQVSDAGLGEIRNCQQILSLSLGRTKATGDGLRHLEGLVKLQFLDLQGTMVDDAGVLHLSTLPQLQELFLGDTCVTSSGIRHLEGNTTIASLTLEGTKVDDSAVDALLSLDRLSSLHVPRTDFSARALQSLRDAIPKGGWFDSDMTDLTGKPLAASRPPARAWDSITRRLVALDQEQRLKFIDLSGTMIDDEHVVSLHELKHVQLIDLRETAVTEHGVQELRRALPECEVRW